MKIAIIKIVGSIDASKDEKRTLDLLRLRKKNVCVLVDKKPEILGMIEKIKRYVCAGEIDNDVFKLLIEKRGKSAGKNMPINISSDKIIDWINKFREGKAKFEDLGIKPFFRLHPPIGGFRKSMKVFWPTGVLGWQGKEINVLIKRMI
ncbi:50S ribosomal protein L30 [Candidatus Pacearchaeota archaeon CG06_land_8_20_14_3_00_35_12]|nr:MAG: 50S ribosomal protein L30 [Candidatus Pacearchaeota archaeon CG06_land_8_20_14_3_00_35_12]